MVFRRRRDDEPLTPPPEWRRRFDAAAEVIRSRQRPAWIDDRLVDLERALIATQHDVDRLGETIARFEPERVSRELKDALRDQQRGLASEPGDGGDKRIAVMRERYAAVNEMMNRRRDLQLKVADSVADLELLAVQAERNEVGLTGDTDALDEHLQRLDVDLQALSMARNELRSW